MEKIRFITERYIKDNSIVTESTQAKQLFPHCDTAQDIDLANILGREYLDYLLNKFNAQNLNNEEVVLVDKFIKPALLFRTLAYALPYLQYDLRSKGLMNNTDDNATQSGFQEFKFILNEMKNRATNAENALKEYLCANSTKHPRFKNHNKKNNTNNFGLIMY